MLRPGGRFAVSDVIADPDMDEADTRGHGRVDRMHRGCAHRGRVPLRADERRVRATIEIRETHRVHEHAVRRDHPRPQADELTTRIGPVAELTPAVVGAQLVAVSFFLLAPYIAFEAAHALLVEHHAETTLLGIRPLDRNAVYLPLAGAGEAPPRRTARLSRHRRRGTTEPHLLLSGRRGSRRAARQHPVRHLVARPGHCARHPRARDHRRAPRLARRIMPMHDLRDGNAAVTPPVHQVLAEENKRLVRRLVQEAVGRRNLDALDEIAAGEFARLAKRWGAAVSERVPGFRDGDRRSDRRGRQGRRPLQMLGHASGRMARLDADRAPLRARRRDLHLRGDRTASSCRRSGWRTT